MKRENKDLKRTQGDAKQEIWEEVKDLVYNEVKTGEEKEKDKMGFKEIFQQ